MKLAAAGLCRLAGVPGCEASHPIEETIFRKGKRRGIE
jgi:hypothetical protein